MMIIVPHYLSTVRKYFFQYLCSNSDIIVISAIEKSIGKLILINNSSKQSLHIGSKYGTVFTELSNSLVEKKTVWEHVIKNYHKI